MPEMLTIQLLGGFSVMLDGQPMRSMRTAKTRALFAYLVTEADQEHSRMKLATLLWGELPDSAAKTNLRIELSNLRRVLNEHPALEVTRNSVRFQRALATTDLHTFVEGLRDYMAMPAETQAAETPALAAATAAYQGDFLAGFTLQDAIEFEDWQLITREQLHEQMMAALNMLQLRYAEQGHWNELAGAARRQIALVPWTESAHRNVMQALAAQGQTQAALAQFERCRAILEEELGVEPSRATVELVARLQGEQAAPTVVQHNLTQQFKSFVGRKAELARVCELVSQQKLVTLLGIGGAGKSHLAQTVAQHVLHDFEDGVWFVPLANISADESAADRIGLAIAAAVGFQVTDMQAPLAELGAYLADKSMLLVLDNWEHLIDAAGTVLYAVLEAPEVHVLATSRVRLMLADEVPVTLDGLPANEGHTLFVARARRMVPTFAQDDDVAVDNEILRLCAQVGGLPLGIELAASWVEHYTVAEICESIVEIAIQPARSAEVVSRHHTLSGVLQYSWQLLSPRQQHILARLAVFHGGFDRGAASAVVESTLSDLSSLIAHSLVQRVGAGRYDLHPLIQEFAGAQLEAADAMSLAARHCRHYLDAVYEAHVQGNKERLRADFDNVRAAWRHASEQVDVAHIQRTARAFGRFYDSYGSVKDGERLFADTVKRLEEKKADPDVIALAIDEWAHFVRTQQGAAGVVPLAKRILELATVPKLRALAHLDIGDHFAEHGKWSEAEVHFDAALATAEDDEDLHTYISVVETREFLYALHFRGDFGESIRRMQELLALMDDTTQHITDRETLYTSLLESLSVIANRYGDYALAIRSSTRAHEKAHEMANRTRITHTLIDLALSEQFAGLYDEAIAHNRAALVIAEESNDPDEKSLIEINLCLTLRQAGELEGALRHGISGAEAMERLHNRRLEGQGRNRIGHTLLALERWEEAYAAYAHAMVVWEPLDHPNRFEAVAGQAVAALRLGHADEALALVNAVMGFVEETGLLGIVEPAHMLLQCALVLGEVGEPEQAQAALTHAMKWMEMIAARISDEAVREVFWQRPDNQRVRSRVAAIVS